nr:uncharacterized protein LOC100179748 [Ciona intestinalis]|eukprot:XP_002121293.1 uncharacterized protein LOC100179748 [Ciona intestinalis]
MVTVEQFSELLKQSEILGISCEQLNKLKAVGEIKNNGKKWHRQNCGLLVAGFLFCLVVCVPSILPRNHAVLIKILLDGLSEVFDIDELDNYSCILTNEVIGPYVRIPVDCNACAGVNNIPKVSNLTQEEFLKSYAFTMQPVVVQDGLADWTASEIFSYDYFKSIYTPGSKALKQVNEKCQFFPYATNISGLEEFFNMSLSRVEGKEDHWYIGWSNCEGQATNELRKHYKLPYFLPQELDHSKLDWVFMGLPGHGAPMHIDFVKTSSWQAQLRGQKKWTFETPPDCFGVCSSKLEVTVTPGEIIVLDGNRWFHQTQIKGNDMSIVIGSEYY